MISSTRGYQKMGRNRTYHANNSGTNFVFIWTSNFLRDVPQTQGDVCRSQFPDQPSGCALNDLIHKSHVFLLQIQIRTRWARGLRVDWEKDIRCWMSRCPLIWMIGAWPQEPDSLAREYHKQNLWATSQERRWCIWAFVLSTDRNRMSRVLAYEYSFKKNKEMYLAIKNQLYERQFLQRLQLDRGWYCSWGCDTDLEEFFCLSPSF